MALQVYTPSGALLHEYDTNRRNDEMITARKVAASSTKVVAALIILALVSDPSVPLTVESTTGEILGWTGREGTITVDMLGNCVSGLDVAYGENCIYSEAHSTFESMSLEECVEYIRSKGIRGRPGTDFQYGAAHWYVLANMAMVATGEDWNTLFETRIKQPLGLTDTGLTFAQWVSDIDRQRRSNEYDYRFWMRTRYDGLKYSGFTLGSNAPNPAAGLLATPGEIMRILSLVSNRGRLPDGTQLINEDLIDMLSKLNFPRARVRSDDLHGVVGTKAYRSGFGTILFCSRSRASWRANPKCTNFGQYSASGMTVWFYDGMYSGILNGKAREGGFSLADSLLNLRSSIDSAIASIVEGAV